MIRSQCLAMSGSHGAPFNLGLHDGCIDSPGAVEVATGCLANYRLESTTVSSTLRVDRQLSLHSGNCGHDHHSPKAKNTSFLVAEKEGRCQL